MLYPFAAFRKLAGALLSGAGFSWNAIRDVTKAGQHHLEWKRALGRLQEYLEDSGIQLEMNLAMNERFITNISVYDEVQREIGHDRQEASKLDCVPSDIPELAEAAHFMRFATAVYGSEMIASSVLECGHHTVDITELDDGNEAHAFAYTRCLKEDAVVVDVNSGGSMDYLRHFCVVDHSKKALVLALRGTFSISGLVTDLVGFTGMTIGLCPAMFQNRKLLLRFPFFQSLSVGGMHTVGWRKWQQPLGLN